MKRKKTDRQKAKEKAWKYFSKFIRLKYSNKEGECRCVTCGVIKKSIGRGCIQAGHFVDGRKNAVLFNEEVVFPQCATCNMSPSFSFPYGKGGNYPEYIRFMVEYLKKDYKAIDNWRRRLKNTILKLSVFNFEEISDKYRKKYDELTKKIESDQYSHKPYDNINMVIKKIHTLNKKKS